MQSSRIIFLVLLALASATRANVVLCNNDCEFNIKGQCDDGGLNSISSLCPFGSDCDDCGSRTLTSSPTSKPTKPTKAPVTKKPTNEPTSKPTKAPVSKKPTLEPTAKPTKAPITKKPTNEPTAKPTKAPVSKKPTNEPTIKPTKAPTPEITRKPTKEPTVKATKKPTWRPTTKAQKDWCTELCETAGNGICEDGGYKSVSNTCTYGSDCVDCGVREPVLVFPGEEATTAKPTSLRPSAKPTADIWLCNELCPWANDGECDDGGPGSMGFMCMYGSDCADCGVREPRDSPFVTLNPTTALRTGVPTIAISGAPTFTNTETSTPAISSEAPTTLSTEAPATESPTEQEEQPATEAPSEEEQQPATEAPTEKEEPPATPTKKATTSPTSKPSKLPTQQPTKKPTALPTTKAPTPAPTKKPTRLPTEQPITVNPDDVWLCNNLCLWPSDGECDDGGPGSTGMMCMYGSDCDDCGVRAPRANVIG